MGDQGNKGGLLTMFSRYRKRLEEKAKEKELEAQRKEQKKKEKEGRLKADEQGKK